MLLTLTLPGLCESVIESVEGEEEELLFSCTKSDTATLRVSFHLILLLQYIWPLLPVLTTINIIARYPLYSR